MRTGLDRGRRCQGNGAVDDPVIYACRQFIHNGIEDTKHKEAKHLFVEIQELTSKIDTFDINDKQNDNPSFPNLCDFTKTDSIDILNKTFKTSETPVIWKNIESDSELIKRWLGEDVSKEFFYLGNLKRIIQPFNILTSVPEIKGTKEETEKHDKLHQLSHKLQLLDVRTNYLNTFNEMCFIPIAIQNISSILDENIRIVVNVECGEIVQPDEHLIWQEYEGLQGLLCRDDDDEKDVGIICELFYLKEDGVIHIEDIPYNPARDLPKMPIITSNGLAQPRKRMKIMHWSCKNLLLPQIVVITIACSDSSARSIASSIHFRIKLRVLLLGKSDCQE